VSGSRSQVLSSREKKALTEKEKTLVLGKEKKERGLPLID